MITNKNIWGYAYVAQAAFDYMVDQVNACDEFSFCERKEIIDWMNEGELLTDMVRAMKNIIESQYPPLQIGKKESEL